MISLSQISAAPWSAWFQLLTTIGGTVIGGIIGYASALGVKRRDERRTATAVRVQLLCMIESARDVLSGFQGFVEDQKSAPSEFRADDPAISVLYERAFASDVALALSPTEARLVHDAVMRLDRTARGIEIMMTILRGKGASITDQLKLPKRVVTSARECVATLDAAHTEIVERLPSSARPLGSHANMRS